MYINKKIEIRGSFPHIKDSFRNNTNQNGKRSLYSSLSMNNIYLLPPSSRQFGKDVKNITNLTVNSYFPNYENIEEKIKYYRKINDDLTNMLNNYDKNFFDENKKLLKKIKNINEENNLLSNLNLMNKSRNNENIKCKKIKIENKENKDNNISYFENFDEGKNENLSKEGGLYKEKTMKIIINNKDNNIFINEKNNKSEKNKKSDRNNKDKNIIDKEKINNIKKSSDKGDLILINNNIKINEENINNKNINNPQEINEYFEEIFYDMQLKENSSLIDPNYFKNTQKFINKRMRAILLDWLIDVHKKYKLKPETIYLTVNIIDRYLSKVSVNTINLQLVGVAALLISSKYEDIYPPKVKELAEITDGAYVANQILVMEEDILSTLNFDLFYPTQWHFLECYKKKLTLNEQSFYLAWYLMELGLIDIILIKYKGSIIASSAVLLSMKYFNIFKKEEFENATGFSEKFLENCINDIKFLWTNKKNEKKLNAVKRKFSHSKFFEVSKLEYEY